MKFHEHRANRHRHSVC